MNFLIFCLTEMAMGLVLWGLLKKGSLRPFPDIAIAYLMHLEFVLYLQVDGIINYDYLESFSSFSFYKDYPVISGLLLLYSGILGLTKSKSGEIIDYKSILYRIEIPQSVIFWFAFLIYLILSVYLLMVNIEIIWKNNGYMLMGSFGAMNYQGRAIILLCQMMNPLSLALSAFIFLLYFKGNQSYIIFIPAWLFRFLFILGGHSRLAALMTAIGMAIALIFGRRKIAFALGVISLIAFAQALDGRSQTYHGLSQVPKAIPYAYEELTKNVDQLAGNSAEGIFTSAETLHYLPKFDSEYIWLSFSPLPSAVDNFAVVNDKYQIGLNVYTPMPAVEEATSFGILFFILYFATQFYAAKIINTKIDKSPNALLIGLNVIVLVGFLQQFAYPVRNVYRFFSYPLIFSYFL